jgi:hypothetical protein
LWKEKRKKKKEKRKIGGKRNSKLIWWRWLKNVCSKHVNVFDLHMCACNSTLFMFTFHTMWYMFNWDQFPHLLGARNSQRWSWRKGIGHRMLQTLSLCIYVCMYVYMYVCCEWFRIIRTPFYPLCLLTS